MDRRGQGISLNVIVIAAIALLILVILSVLVLRTGGKVTTGTQCESLGGTCYVDGYWGNQRCDSENGWSYDATASCSQSTSDTPYYCCRKI
jgi:hypothetical protein